MTHAHTPKFTVLAVNLSGLCRSYNILLDVLTLVFELRPLMSWDLWPIWFVMLWDVLWGFFRPYSSKTSSESNEQKLFPLHARDCTQRMKCVAITNRTLVSPRFLQRENSSQNHEITSVCEAEAKFACALFPSCSNFGNLTMAICSG